METTWKRWQDYATMLLGVLLFVAPFVFADTLGGSAAWTGYILGVLLFVAGLVGAAQADPRGAAGVAVVLGILAFIAPWVLGFTAMPGMAWALWVLGILAVVNAGSQLNITTHQRRLA